MALKCRACAQNLYGGISPASRRHLRGTSPGKDNLAPAEDVHNKNPSLVALGKTDLLENN